MKLDVYAISVGLARMYGLDVPPARIHVWGTRGKVGRYGRGPDGKTLYDLDEVRRHAELTCLPQVPDLV